MLRPALLLTLAVSVYSAETKLGEHTFTLPEGLEIQVAAAPPLIERPITMAFDESGALYVADSSGSNDKVEKQLEEKPHRIVRLVDRDQDGVFDTSTVFADKMMFPEGTMWLDGSLYVSAPPQIWKLTDTNDDGVADQRSVWFDGKTLTGCANDLHGPYAGPDGFIYWCKGAFAEQRHKLANGTNLVTRASHIFRARPDGSNFESVLTGGMDNPVDVVFTPNGERLLDGTFFVHPSGGKRDGILHAVYGGVWGKDHAVLAGHPRTGDLMPIMTHLGPGAPAGMELLRAGAWGAEWQGNVFASNFNLRKITRHVLSPDGATFKTADTDFVVSDRADFHPTDVLETLNGDLLIADTGGWYKLCCPTSQLHKPDVLGAIYLVRKRDARPAVDAADIRQTKKEHTPEALAAQLEDARPLIVEPVMTALANLGDRAVAPLAEWINTTRPGTTTKPVTARLNAVWTLTRIPGDSARAAVRFAFADRDINVRIAACHSAGLWRDRGATEALVNQLAHANLHLRRAAAEALGRIGDAGTAPAIVAAAHPKFDRVLEHSVSFALIELRAIDAARAALKSANQGSVRVGLAALHQLGALRSGELMPLLGTGDSETTRLAEWIAAQHADWGDPLADWLRTRLPATANKDRAPLANVVVRLTSNEAIQKFVGELAASTDPGERQLAFEIIGKSGLKEIPQAWSSAIAAALGNGGKSATMAIEALGTFGSAKMFPLSLRTALLEAAGKDASSADRLNALRAIPGTLGKLSDGLFDLLGAETRSDDIMRVRTAASLLSRAELNEAQLSVIAESLPTAHTGALAALLEIFRARRDEFSSKLLVQHLAKVPALPAPIVRSVVADHPEATRNAVETLLSTSNRSSRARLDQLISEMPKGDIRRGHLLFQSTRSACATCHAMAYTGGNLGPDLTRIGSIRTERDLLEAIIFPSASFVRSYEPVMVKARTAGEHLGILKEEDGEKVVFATGPAAEVQLSRDEIVSMEPAPISLMPQGYDGIFTPQDLADLVAFLKAAK